MTYKKPVSTVFLQPLRQFEVVPF